MPREQFLLLLANFIKDEAELYCETHAIDAAELNEPYRAAGDRLVDAALYYIN
jgi:hypothetical protein